MGAGGAPAWWDTGAGGGVGVGAGVGVEVGTIVRSEGVMVAIGTGVTGLVGSVVGMAVSGGRGVAIGSRAGPVCIGEVVLSSGGGLGEVVSGGAGAVVGGGAGPGRGGRDAGALGLPGLSGRDVGQLDGARLPHAGVPSHLEQVALLWVREDDRGTRGLPTDSVHDPRLRARAGARLAIMLDDLDEWWNDLYIETVSPRELPRPIPIMDTHPVHDYDEVVDYFGTALNMANWSEVNLVEWSNNATTPGAESGSIGTCFVLFRFPNI